MKVRHITLPGGFVAAGAAAGIKTSGAEDVTIIAAKADALHVNLDKASLDRK